MPGVMKCRMRPRADLRACLLATSQSSQHHLRALIDERLVSVVKGAPEHRYAVAVLVVSPLPRIPPTVLLPGRRQLHCTGARSVPLGEGISMWGAGMHRCPVC